MTIENYYNILGVQKNASLEDIKKAYRAKAKILHPDKNKSSDAHEDFILLSEAYECLENIKTGKLYDQTKKTRTARPKSKSTYEDWKNTEKEKARARAQQYAKMQYAEFIKTDYYKSLSSIDTIVSHFGFFIAISVIVIVPIVAMIVFGFAGFGAGLLINFMALPMTVSAIRDSPALNLGEFFNSVFYIVKTNGFLITSLTIINIIVILKFGLQTLISPWILITAYCVPIGCVYLIFRATRQINRIYYYSFGIIPMVINSLLLINFIFSFNPVKETYEFQNDVQYVIYQQKYRPITSTRQKDSYIYLKNNAYGDFPGIRVFLDYEEMKYSKHITYTFRNGILGLRVMTDYKFI